MAADLDWKKLGDEAVEVTQQYLRLDTTNPPGNETPAAEFLAGILGDAGYETTVLESAPGGGTRRRYCRVISTASSPSLVQSIRSPIPGRRPGRPGRSGAGRRCG